MLDHAGLCVALQHSWVAGLRWCRHHGLLYPPKHVHRSYPQEDAARPDEEPRQENEDDE